MSPRHPGRRTLLIGAMAILIMLVGAPAFADPINGGPGDEGADATTEQVLETSTRAWVDAKAAYDSSVKRQADLTTKLAATQAELAVTNEQVGSIALAAYRTGGLTTAAMLIDAKTPDGFVQRATAIDALAHHNDNLLRTLHRLNLDQTAQKKALDAEIVTQKQQFDLMAQKKAEAEKALTLVGGPANGFVSATSPVAQPAPRAANGSWPKESCSVNDPTTTGCITPRTMHAMQQAQAAGFNRFVSCFRPSGPYEHPKGRACDFSVQSKGFGGVATGDDKVYGTNLAVYFVRNADRLGILYVIWFKQIWTPAVGWHHYSGVGGDPSSDHTNHVHLSEI